MDVWKVLNINTILSIIIYCVPVLIFGITPKMIPTYPVLIIFHAILLSIVIISVILIKLFKGDEGDYE